MATWKSRGLRGSALEDMINYTNEIYKSEGLALVQKIPTPITPVNIDRTSRHITLAYFDKKSTVDYIGVVQGIPVCFDAKECAAEIFPLSNVHIHQMEFMRAFEKQAGTAFLIVFFTSKNEAYYIPFSTLSEFWQRMLDGGKKSFSYNELDKSLLINIKNDFMLHYLEQLEIDLKNRYR
ncbi:recombination protein U [Johnsonella ignava ATCC 51276]|uniref:Holliday junction resolvase RecU n=1 Tax=Johnsonella ignava ATCC 51276 TaxID=679200 RepID=G5GGS7_9FIRM|nr:Holliday junction resolvase RecU [Johnsonella ignava]EHI55985.1 recombination protein U [Johnsonella ignava ATCC 51276]